MAKKKPKPRRTLNDQIDRELAASALAKRQGGETPTTRELTALRRVQKQKEDSDREDFLRTVPKGIYNKMSGRQTKILHEQASLYDLPIRGRTVDLYEVVERFHDILRDNKHRLSGQDEDEWSAVPNDDPDKRRKLIAEADMAEMRRDRERGDLVDAEKMAAFLDDAGSLIHGLGESFLEMGMNDANDRLNEVVDEFEQLIERFFTDDRDAGDNTTER